MKHKFSEVPKAEIPRSTFDRSHGHKTTYDAGWLIPVLVDEALPGDTFKLSATLFARLSTPIHPIMDNMYQDVHFFSVPVRLLWDNWQKFNGEQDNPGDSTDYLVPVVTPPVGGFTAGTIFDYFGIPLGIANGPSPVSALFARAYNRVYKDWYRDQNLINSPTIKKNDGPDLVTDYPLQRRGKRHDYFTSALPWPQKGPGVMVPIGGAAPVTADTWLKQYSMNGSTSGNAQAIHTAATVSNAVGTVGNVVGDTVLTTTRIGTADLSAATGATINSMRQAFQIQKIYERDARGGTRYIEIIKAHFGVTSPDARLQRPEYLGGMTAPINVSPVPQTSAAAAQPSPQGNLAAYATALSNGGFTASFTEHCIIIGIASVRADLTYQQGLERQFSRRTRFDFYWPALSHLGEQTILNKEIYAQGGANDELVFGYQERHAEYRYKNSYITGKFRSTDPTPLDNWHLSQKFLSLPVLGKTFIEEDPPVDRVIAVPSEPHFIADMYFNMHCTRPMPVYGVPGLIDHF